MKMWKPNIKQFITAIRIQHRVENDVNGAPDISYVPENDIQYCDWKGKGGTESTESGTVVVYDTAEITMWFNPVINEKDRVLLNDDETLGYEIVNVENVQQRNMYIILKVKRVVSA
jgi:hypothetical protein